MALDDLQNLAVLLVCRNRRETTLRALRRLHGQAGAGVAISVFLFDDASTDGTPEAVAAHFPDTTIIHGDGDAFWNGGLYRVWMAALPHAPDAFLWLNDDVALAADAVARMAEAWRTARDQAGNHRFILVGATIDAAGRPTYGGKRWRPRRTALVLDPIAPGERLTPIDAFNGNIVLVPRAVSDEIGINDPAYFHNLGDLDYGLRATRAGIRCLLLPGFLGQCDLNAAKASGGYGARGLGLAEQWRMVNTHHGLPFASWFRMTRRHSGRWWPLHFLLPYRWLVTPRLAKAKKGTEA